MVCASWNCGRAALDPRHRMILRRAVVGINEKLDYRSMWGCLERMVTVPYTPSSGVTTTSNMGGRSAEERTIPFFFVGTGRGRPERENLQVSAWNGKLELGNVITIQQWAPGAKKRCFGVQARSLILCSFISHLLRAFFKGQ